MFRSGTLRDGDFLVQQKQEIHHEVEKLVGDIFALTRELIFGFCNRVVDISTL